MDFNSDGLRKPNSTRFFHADSGFEDARLGKTDLKDISREGFYRETLCPFRVSQYLFGDRSIIDTILDLIALTGCSEVC